MRAVLLVGGGKSVAFACASVSCVHTSRLSFSDQMRACDKSIDGHFSLVSYVFSSSACDKSMHGQ